MRVRAPTTIPPAAAAMLARLGVVVLAILASLMVAAAVAAAPRTPGRLAAVFPPWWSRGQVLAAAASTPDVAIGGVGGLAFILILRSDAPGLDGRLRQAGALLLLDADGAGLCGPLFPETRS